MIIRFTKRKQDRPETLTCVRDNGSCTWQKSSDYFVRHDLIHFAVETTLGYKDAFWGLVAQGKDLDGFGTQGGVKDVYTREEGWAESLVGVLQWSSISGGPDLTKEELLTMLAKACAGQGALPLPLTPEQIARIREQIRALHKAWDQISAGETMELIF